MDHHQYLKKDLQEAWSRLADNTHTCEDLTLIFDSVNDPDHLPAFYEVWDRAGRETAMNQPPLTEEQKEAYRKKIAQIIAESGNNRRERTTRLPSRNISRFRKIWYAAAAVFMLGMLIPAAYIYIKSNIGQTESFVQYAEVITQRGEIRTVLLPDQTEVTLNAESRLNYPTVFSNERSVELQGEALFDVTSDPARPFTVKTENMNIKVVGTVFNVKEYTEDLSSSVSVASGKVEVGLVGEKITLTQNQQVKMDKSTGNFEKMTIDAGNYLSWTSGTLYFQQTPIREVVNILNRHYPQVNIELAEGEYTNHISGKYKDVFTTEDILKSIVYITGLKCIKTENKYILQ